MTWLFSGCAEKDRSAELVGKWLFSLDLGGTILPFNAEMILEEDAVQFYAINGEERIRADEFEVIKDSFFVRLPVFNTALIGKITEEGIIGSYHDYSRSGEYLIPFEATRSFENRFDDLSEPTIEVTGKWKVLFSPGSDSEYEAIGQFQQLGARATGTFLTTTGDYRYLEGNVSGDSLFLSCFDGSHAFLFKARISGDSIYGNFWSGRHWQENWTGNRDEAFDLPDPETLTFLKPGYESLDFSFQNLKGETVSISDSAYQDKVVIVQIMGSWCPNCKDETAYLVSLHEKFKDQGLEVIALAFEKSDNNATNVKSLERLVDHFNVPYKVLLAGTASKKEAAAKLPMLNHVLSFPTSIYIDRTGKVRKIHTGFSGPGTGEYYQEFVEETDRFVTQLLIE
ncbi:MAG: redoxin domain-containing protein [Flavobacteriales bacterium]|nr:redoxin domain-containing protein [Flavobacteriales bacterium]